VSDADTISAEFAADQQWERHKYTGLMRWKNGTLQQQVWVERGAALKITSGVEWRDVPVIDDAETEIAAHDR
jgi:hypothetical protein